MLKRDADNGLTYNRNNLAFHVKGYIEMNLVSRSCRKSVSNENKNTTKQTNAYLILYCKNASKYL